jgi:predicted dehydrogenase
MKTIRVALAGRGFIGSIHARSLVLAKNSTLAQKIKVELVVAADTDQARAQFVAQQYGWQHTVTNWKEIFEYSPDLIVVALPNSEHVAIVEQASKRNVAVLLEKPMTSTYEEAIALHDAVKDNDRIRVAYMNRFVPAVQRAKELIDSGQLGAIRMVRSVYLLNMRKPHGPVDWRFDAEQAGHGASDDLGSHHVDLLRMLVGEIESVTALTRTWDIPDGPKATNDDAMAALLTFKNGAIGTMSVSRTSPGHPLTGYIEIDGEKGSLRVDRAYLNDLFIRDENGVVQQKSIRPFDPFVGMWALPTVQGAHPFGWYDCFAFQMAEMLLIAAGISRKHEWSAQLVDGLRSMAITESRVQAASRDSLLSISTVPHA